MIEKRALGWVDDWRCPPPKDGEPYRIVLCSWRLDEDPPRRIIHKIAPLRTVDT